MNNSLNTFYMRANCKELILNLFPFIAIYPGYYGPHTIFVFVVASYISWKLLLKNKLWHCSCCHRYLDKQIKTYRRLHENRVHMDFSLKGCQIYLVPFNMTMTLDFQYGHPCLVITYLIQNNSYLLELNREYFDDLWLKWNSYFKFKNSIQLPVSCMDHGDKTYTNIFAIYLVLWLKIHIHAWVWCNFEWQSPVTLGK